MIQPTHSDPLIPMCDDEVRTATRDDQPRSVAHAAPDWMQSHVYEATYDIPRPIQSSWRWLNDPNTFIQGQFWPYRVEFVSPDPDVPPGFHIGVLNTHHGPWLNCAGVITDIRPMRYRDLQYFYGAYAIGPRWIRPTRLQFWTDPVDDGTRLRLRVDSFIRPGWTGTWDWLQKQFWRRFPVFMRKGIDAAESSQGLTRK